MNEPVFSAATDVNLPAGRKLVTRLGQVSPSQAADLEEPEPRPNLDAFLSPVCFVAAFQHDHSPDFDTRKVTTTAGERPYLDLMKWIAPATLIGCPATTVPVGRTAAGLPVSLQIVGPYMEDATPIDIAIKMPGLPVALSLRLATASRWLFVCGNTSVHRPAARRRTGTWQLHDTYLVLFRNTGKEWKAFREVVLLHSRQTNSRAVRPDSRSCPPVPAYPLDSGR